MIICSLFFSLSLLSATQIPESTLVSKIYFQGNKSFKSKLLKKVLLVKEKNVFYETELDRDLRSLKSFYETQGFQNIKVEGDFDTKPKGKIIYFKIIEGTRVRISSIKISGNSSFSEKKIQSLFLVKKSDYLITDKIDDAEKAIIKFYKNSGYPYVTIERHVSFDNNLAVVNFVINEGGLAFIKELKVRGNHKVSNTIILRTTEIKAGEKFSLNRLERARQRLYATKLFERVSFYVLDMENKDSLTIRLDVLELPPRSIGFGVGVQTPPTRLLLGSEWEHLNFLKKGHDLFFSLSYAPTFTSDWRGEIKNIYRIFYVLNSPINFAFQPSFKYERKDSVEHNEFNIEAGLSRFFGSKLEVGTYLRYLRVKRITTENTEGTEEENSVYSVSSVVKNNPVSTTNSQNFFLRYDTRDNLFVPQKGIFFTTNIQFAGSVYSGDNDFYKTRSELSVFYPILFRFVLGCRLMSGIAIPYSRTSEVPYFDAFSLGGNNGLRGYSDKAIGPTIVNDEHYGEAINNMNIELRTRFEKLIDFVGFFDLGKVSERKGFMNLEPELFDSSAGVGIRINTPLGPVRVDYGKRLKDAPLKDWGKIYLGLLNTF